MLKIQVAALALALVLCACKDDEHTPQTDTSVAAFAGVDTNVAYRARTPEGYPVHVFPEHATEPNARDPHGVLFTAPAESRDALSGPSALAVPLKYHGGPLLLHAHVVNVLWGNWTPAASVATRVEAFERVLGTSGEYAVITQYGDKSGNRISLTDLAPKTVAFPTGATGIVSTAQIRSSLLRLIREKTLPAPTADTLYVVLLAPGIAAQTSDGWSSCNSGLQGKKFCGYHSVMTSGSTPAPFAVIVYPSCRGCQGHPIPNIPLPASGITPIVEHEIRESATDKLFTGWFNARGEADDICNWDTFVDAGYQHQREWSNAAMRCVAKGVSGP